MADEPEAADLFKIPFKQKDAWDYAFKAGLLAGYFWAIGHFVSLEKYERDLEKEDAKRAIILTTMGDLSTKVGIVDEHVKNYDDFKQRLLNLENRPYASHP